MVTHAYEREGTLRYLRVLNDQLVSVEAIELLLKDYKRSLAQLQDYNGALDECIRIYRKKNGSKDSTKRNNNLQRLASSVSAYYIFVDFVGGVKAAKVMEFFGKAMDPLVANLAALVETAAIKEQSLASKMQK